MPCFVAVFDIEKPNDLPLTQEPLPVLPPYDVPIAAAAQMNLHVDDDTSTTTDEKCTLDAHNLRAHSIYMLTSQQ